MRITHTVNRIDVLGRIWMPSITCAYSYELSGYDLQNVGELTRENVQLWLDQNAGDFSEIIDFSVNFGDEEFVSPWADEESEYLFLDAMYGSES
jgi:hypothetical protein